MFVELFYRSSDSLRTATSYQPKHLLHWISDDMQCSIATQLNNTQWSDISKYIYLISSQ